MELKEFRGKTYEEAALAMRMALGSDAVIVSEDFEEENRFFGLFPKKVFKITAYKNQKIRRNDDQEEHRMNLEKEKLRAFLENVQNIRKNNTAPASATAAISKAQSCGEIRDVNDRITQQLEQIQNIKKDVMKLEGLSQNVQRTEKGSEKIGRFSALLTELDYERKMVEKITAEISEQGITGFSIMKKKFVDRLKETIQLQPRFEFEHKPLFIMMVGTTGEGKTSTLIKLAYNWIVNKKKKVSVINNDTSRIGAIAQIESCIEMMEHKENVRCRSVFNIEEFKETIAEYSDSDVIFIDTAGRNQKNDEEIQELKQITDILSGQRVEKILVMNSMKKYRDMAAIINKFDEIDISRIVFTMIDEGTSLGPCVSALYYSGIPLAYFTNGKGIDGNLKKPLYKDIFFDIEHLEFTEENDR